MPKVSFSLGSSFEKLFNKAPNPSKLRVFSFFMCSHPYSSHKLNPKSRSCVFLGYSLTQSEFIYCDPTLKKIIVSRHVKFMKNVFPFASLSTSTTPVTYIDLALPVSLTLSDYPTPPPPFPLPILSTSPELLRSSPSPYPSSRRTASPLLIPPTSPELLHSSPS